MDINTRSHTFRKIAFIMQHSGKRYMLWILKVHLKQAEQFKQPLIVRAIVFYLLNYMCIFMEWQIQNCKLFVLLFFIVVILDLKGLYLLVVGHDDENFKLAKKGIEMDFCFIRHAMRVCGKCSLLALLG